ncbi:MAG: M15 family metallopeptidase [Myxococcaceae bacterium]|nr:M15 family metallopeptidase [Myxococcaceae bacterium]
MTFALLLVLGQVTALEQLKADESPPKGLECLARYYLGSAVKHDGRWWLSLGKEGELPWESPDGPDLEGAATALSDLFRVPYVTGPITPVEGPEDAEDPGRTRVDGLFKATYGATRREVEERLGRWRFRGVRYPVHERAVAAFDRVSVRIDALLKEKPKLSKFVENIGGTWSWRTIARTKVMSTHAFGIAVDLNVDLSHYWRWVRPRKPLKWKNRFPQEIVDAFEAEGFIWGGRWVHFDTMHFEYRPELLDPSCREGVVTPPARDGGTSDAGTPDSGVR